jgi:hypothetical protein
MDCGAESNPCFSRKDGLLNSMWWGETDDRQELVAGFPHFNQEDRPLACSSSVMIVRVALSLIPMQMQ